MCEAVSDPFGLCVIETDIPSSDPRVLCEAVALEVRDRGRSCRAASYKISSAVFVLSNGGVTLSPPGWFPPMLTRGVRPPLLSPNDNGLARGGEFTDTGAYDVVLASPYGLYEYLCPGVREFELPGGVLAS